MFARQFMVCGRRINSYAKSLRGLHCKPESLSEVNDIEIPVPWGKISGKLWGMQQKQPILAMHGWQDNAASFDCLAPLIVKNTPVLAIDLPGHGLSSWLPPGFMYMELVYFMLIKRIQKYFGWKKVKILGHSLSTMTAYWYAATFPMDMQYVVALDFFKFPTIETDMYAEFFGKAVNGILKLEENSNAPPRYSEDEIKTKWFGGYMHLDDKACKILMSRSVTQQEDGKYTFNRDPRLRVLPVHSMFSREQLEDFARLIKCPYLILKAENSFWPEKEEYYYSALEIMKASNNNLHFKKMPGTHHLHLTDAETTAVAINEFLEKYD